MENWKKIKGYDYWVSSFGNVKSKKKKLKPHKNTAGYLGCNIYKDKKPKHIMIHQYVAIYFKNHKPCGQKLVVDHINNIKTDNRAENLRIITQRENTNKDKPLPMSGYRGVSWGVKNKKWVVRPRLNGVKVLVGYFDDPKEAAQAYQKAIKIDPYNKIITFGF